MRHQFLASIAALFFTYHALGVICFQLAPTLRKDWLLKPFAPYLALIGHHREYSMFGNPQKPIAETFSLIATDTDGKAQKFNVDQTSFRTRKVLHTMTIGESAIAHHFLMNYLRRACREIGKKSDFSPRSISLEAQILRTSSPGQIQLGQPIESTYVKTREPQPCF